MLSELLGALQTLIHLGKLWNYLIFLPLKVLFYVSQLMCPHCALKKKKTIGCQFTWIEFGKQSEQKRPITSALYNYAEGNLYSVIQLLKLQKTCGSTGFSAEALSLSSGRKSFQIQTEFVRKSLASKIGH